VHDRAEGVDRLALQQDVDLDQVGRLLAGGLVVQRGVAPVRDFSWSKKSKTISASGSV
jgi:hypothetical protein